MSVAVGRLCVDAVAEICLGLGFSVFIPSKETCGPWDMLVNDMRVQVKTRASQKEQRNRVRLRTYMGSGKVAYASKDVDVFVIQHFGRWYVIPSDFLANKKGEIGNGIYMPTVGPWADRWDVLDGARVAYEHQKCFDF